MTYIQRTFLKVLCAGLHGKTLSVELSQEEWQELFRLASLQHLLPIIFEAVRTTKAAAENVDLFLKIKQTVVQEVISQTARGIDFRHLYCYLREKGVHPINVKGELCNRLYPLRNYRISVDNDIYVSKAEFPSVHKALLEYGLHTETSNALLETEDEITYRDKENNFYIELHLSLFDSRESASDDLNAFFTDVFQNHTETDGFLTMSPHQHMLYLLLHAYKHFVYSGVGIRQTCDIGFWAVRYADSINWPQLLSQCGSVRAAVFVAAQYRIAEQYLKLMPSMPDCFQKISVDTDALLQDMLIGGIYGANSLTRLHTSTMTLNAIKANRIGRKESVLTSIFPSREYMAGRFPYLQKFPLLLPVAWLSRIAHYLKELNESESSSAYESIQLAKERINLLKQYDIIDK